MSKIQKDVTNAKSPQDNLNPVPDKINAAKQDQPVNDEIKSEQAQLADLQEIERRYQTVFEAAPIGIVIANPQGYFLEVNDAFIKMLGYSRQEIGKITFVDLTHPDDRAETRGLSQAVRDGKINFYRSEKRYLKKNGDVVWTVVRATAIRNDDGSIKYWLGLMVDITEHKKAKEALAESEKKYRMLFESSAEGILVAQIEDQKFKYANRTICNMLGYGSEELTRMGVHDLHAAEDLPYVLDEFEALARGEKGLAESGQKAIQIFERLSGRIDLVILDMIMPEMGGSETFDQLKAIAPDTKVLLSSGYSIDGQASQIMKRGCNGFIQKPFNLKHFSQKIREILDE